MPRIMIDQETGLFAEYSVSPEEEEFIEKVRNHQGEMREYIEYHLWLMGANSEYGFSLKLN